MKAGRFAVCVIAGLVLSELLAVLVHGFILGNDYEPFRGSLLRAFDNNTWQVMLLPVAHLSFVLALVWVYGRAQLRGPAVIRGLKLAVVGWMIGQAPLWLLWYAEQPWPGSLVLKQLGLELLSSVVLGVVIASIGGQVIRADAPSAAR